MNSQEDLQSQKCQFLEAMATKYGFGGDCRIVFLERFNESNAKWTNDTLAQRIKWNVQYQEELKPETEKSTKSVGLADPRQRLQEHLTKIYKVLEDDKSGSNAPKRGKGRPAEQEIWLDLLKWLREEEYPKWCREQNSRLGADAALIERNGKQMSSAFDEEGQSSISTNIKNNASQTGTDLRGADLTDADLGQANLHSTMIDDTTIIDEKWRWVRQLSNQRTEGEDLSHAVLSDLDQGKGKDLSGKDLSDANLSGYDLSKANLSKANLSKANLSKANLSKANLSKANLSKANLSKANLGSADLSGADLRGADLSGADLSGAKLDGTQIDDETQLDDKWLLVWKIVNRGAEGEDLSGKDLSNANLSHANLRHANLRHANLRHANLRHANLRHANLSCADVSDAKLSRADLSFASVQGTRFKVGKGLPEKTRLDLKRRGANFEDSLGIPRLTMPRLTMPELDEGDRTLIFVILSFAACAVVYEIVATRHNRTHPQEPQWPTIVRQIERTFGGDRPNSPSDDRPNRPNHLPGKDFPTFRSPQHR